MVGVPKSRGCDGCRKQKQKCIVTSKPPCARCHRLNIPCVGYGERRYKFQEESMKLIGRDREKKTSKVGELAPRELQLNLFRKQRSAEPDTPFYLHPTNDLSKLVASYSYTIHSESVNTGYDLIWNFGGYLRSVPRYLGTNKALDAAAQALIEAYHHFRKSRYSPPTTACLVKYSETIKNLISCLSSTESACEPTTLCAIMIVMILEALLNITTGSAFQHSGGAAKILKCRGPRSPKDDLERSVLMALRGPIVIQSFYLDESYFSDIEWQCLITGFTFAENIPDADFFDGLAAAARLYQKTRKILSQSDPPAYEIERLSSHILLLHHTITKRLEQLSYHLEELHKQIDADFQSLDIVDHGFCVRGYGLTLATQIVVNCMLATFRKESSTLTKLENESLCSKICELGESDALYHQPLGSSWLLIALSAAYVGAASDQEKTRVMLLCRNNIQNAPDNLSEMQPAFEVFAMYVQFIDLIF